MSTCAVTAAVGISCKDSIGGLRNIYVVDNYYENIEETDTVTGTSFLVTDFGMPSWRNAAGNVPTTITVYRYALKPNLSSLTITTNADATNGTTFYTQSLSVTLQKLDPATAYQLRLLAYGRSQIFVQDNNDNIMLLGYNNGVDVTGGTAITGVAKGDLAGFTVEAQGEERAPYMQITGTPVPGDAKYPFDKLAAADIAALTITTA